MRLAPADLVTSHPTFLALDPDPVRRALAYQAWLRATASSEELKDIREHLRQERALGDTKFQAMVEKALGHHASLRSPGRPKRVADDF